MGMASLHHARHAVQNEFNPDTKRLYSYQQDITSYRCKTCRLEDLENNFIYFFRFHCHSTWSISAGTIIEPGVSCALFIWLSRRTMHDDLDHEHGPQTRIMIKECEYGPVTKDHYTMTSGPDPMNMDQ